MTAAKKVGEIVKCELWLRQMQEAGFTPTEVQFTTLASAAKEGADLGKAEELLNACMERSRSPSYVLMNAVIDQMAFFNVEASRTTYCTIMNAW